MRVNLRVVVMNALRPLYGEREARNIAKYLIPEFVFIKDLQELKKALDRLKNGEPWQYVIEKEWFYDLEFRVTPDVLIPRPETEELVHLILNDFPENKELKVLDIGTGSGCIPVALKKNRTNWAVSACDISEKALELARYNAHSNQAEILFFRENILNPNFSELLWDVIISNPPYIPQHEKSKMHANVLDFEPHEALFVSDDDPLLFYRRIGEYAQKHLTPYGILYFELNEFYAVETKELIKQLGFKNVEIVRDLMDKPRILKAEKTEAN